MLILNKNIKIDEGYYLGNWCAFSNSLSYIHILQLLDENVLNKLKTCKERTQLTNFSFVFAWMYKIMNLYEK